MKEITSAIANKLIRKLEDEKNYLETLEASSSIYTLSEGETTTPPEYDYQQTSDQLSMINQKIRKLKHAVNVFNTTTVLPELDLTIDEALVKMAQMNQRKNRLDQMRKHLPKQRLETFTSRTKAVAEYEYTNYDLQIVNLDYKKLCDEITSIQLALDTCNQTKTFAIDPDII